MRDLRVARPAWHPIIRKTWFLKRVLTVLIFLCYNKVSNEGGLGNEQSNDFWFNSYGMSYYRYDWCDF